MPSGGYPLLREAPGDRDLYRARTLWISILEGAITTVFLSWTSGAVLTGYLLYLGAGPLILAAAASVPLLVQMANPLLAWVVSRQTRRLRFIGVMATIGRGVWLLAVLLPLLGLPPAWWPLVMLGLMAFSSLVQTGAGPGLGQLDGRRGPR
jgi:hypothetical protein